MTSTHRDPCPRFRFGIHRVACITTTALIVLLTLPGATHAQTGDRWSVYGYGLLLDPSGDRVDLDRTSPATQTVDENASGFGAELAFRFAQRWSLVAGVLFFDLESELASGAARERRELGVYAPYVGLDWHFGKGGRTDVFLGAFVIQPNYEDVIFFGTTSRREVLRYDDDYGFGLRLGFDWAFRRGGPWSLRADLRAFEALLESENSGEDLALDPVMVTVGVVARW